MLLAGTLWMLAAVLAWPWGHPAVGAAVLIGQAVAFIALALVNAGRPSVSGSVRGRRRTGR